MTQTINNRNKKLFLINTMCCLSLSIFPSVGFCGDSTIISPQVVTTHLNSYVLASGTIPGLSGGGPSSIYQIIVNSPMCTPGTTPFVTAAPQANEAIWNTTVFMLGIYVYPISASAYKAAGSPIQPVTKGCCFNSANAGSYVETTTYSFSGSPPNTTYYMLTFRDEIYYSAGWVSGFLDIAWTLYCLNSTDYNNSLQTIGTVAGAGAQRG